MIDPNNLGSLFEVAIALNFAQTAYSQLRQDGNKIFNDIVNSAQDEILKIYGLKKDEGGTYTDGAGKACTLDKVIQKEVDTLKIDVHEHTETVITTLQSLSKITTFTGFCSLASLFIATFCLAATINSVFAALWVAALILVPIIIVHVKKNKVIEKQKILFQAHCTKLIDIIKLAKKMSDKSEKVTGQVFYQRVPITDKKTEPVTLTKEEQEKFTAWLNSKE